MLSSWVVCLESRSCRSGSLCAAAAETLDPFWREVVPLGVFVLASELGVMVEMPARELRGRQPARHRVEPCEEPIRGHAATPENSLMDDLVQEHGEREDHEPKQERRGQPDVEFVEAKDQQRRDRGQQELADRDQGVKNA